MKIEVNDEGGVVSGQVYIGDTDVPTEFLDASSIQICETLQTDISPSMGLLPPAVRWISADKRLVAFERPPCVQKVDIIPMYKDQISAQLASDGKFTSSYYLPMPWTVYLVQFDAQFNPSKVRVFARPNSLESLDDEVHLLPLLNLYFNGAVCNPNHSVYEERTPSVALGVQEAYNIVWNSGFNMDLKDAVIQGIQQQSPVKGKGSMFAGLDATTTRILNFFTAWSKLHIEDVLEAYWAPVSFYEDQYEEDQEVAVEAYDNDGNTIFDEDGVPIMIKEFQQVAPRSKSLRDIINDVTYHELLVSEPTPQAMMVRMTNVIMASAIL